MAAAADGTVIARVPAPKPLGEAQARLRALQRKTARQAARSAYRAAGLAPLAAHPGADQAGARPGRRSAPRHIARATAALAQRHQVIVVEDLNVTGMSRRKPGAGRGGRGLNRAIADAAMAEVHRQLAYKSTWYGARLVVAGRWYPSSKTCSACGVVKAKLALAERNWTCEGCGTRHDREVNAAINLARLSEHALGVEGRPAGTGPVAGRGAIRKTSSPPGAVAGGEEASTSHGGPPAAAGQTGPPLSQERLPDHETR